MTTNFSSRAIATSTPSCVVNAIAPDAAALRAGYASYGAYLASADWRLSPARLSALKFAAGRCRICGTGPGPLECHHSSYARVGSERRSDLIAICRPCHAGVTAMLRERGTPSAYSQLILRIVDGPGAGGLLGIPPRGKRAN